MKARMVYSPGSASRAPGLEQAFHDAGDDILGAVAADFKAFLTSEALTFFKESNQDFVNMFAFDAVIPEIGSV
jgi:hypothetical protein